MKLVAIIIKYSFSVKKEKFFALFANLFVIIRTPYGNYGQEILILTSYTLLWPLHHVAEGISSGLPFIYPRKQTIGFLFGFIYALSGASWLTARV